MLFYGPPGTGKTSTILALAKQLYGPELAKTRVLELNASDERGISIVREKVKDFARQQLSNPPAGPAGVEYRKKYPCPPFKIIVLDEADSMTQDAQSALRRTMETYSKITRFCLVCNYVTRIIDPLASRCSKFRFKSLDVGSAAKRLEEIAQWENVKLEDGAVDALVTCSEGDLRKAITFLQSGARLAGALKAERGTTGRRNGKSKAIADDSDAGDAMDVDAKQPLITTSMVHEIAGVVPTPIISSLFNTLTSSSNINSLYTPLSTAVTSLIADGWSATQLLTQLYEIIMYDESSISDLAKTKIAMVFSETDKRLIDGADEELEVLDLVLRIGGYLG